MKLIEDKLNEFIDQGNEKKMLELWSMILYREILSEKIRLNVESNKPFNM